jgi:hypothetical protein
LRKLEDFNLSKRIQEANRPACSEALGRLQALLIASREFEEVHAKRKRAAADSTADDKLLEVAWQKKQNAKAALLAHTIHHGCLPL